MGIVKVGSDSRVRRDGNKLEESGTDDSEFGDGEIDDEVGKKDQKISKSKKTL